MPKLLLEVAGRPFADLQLEMLARAGYESVVLCVAHLAEAIREHVGDGSRWGLRVDYSEEGPTLLGTGGALRAAAAKLEPTFLVTYGDSYLPFDYAAPLAVLEAHADCDGVMSVFENAGKWDASNVRVGSWSDASGADGTWVLAYEKGTKDPRFDHIDYGAIALRKTAVLELPEGEKVGLDVLQTRLAERQRLRAYVAHERFYEIGSPEGLAALEGRLKDPG